MANVIGKKFAKKDLLGSTRDISPFIKSGTHISHGKHFLNEHKQKPELYRMSSQPSQAHIQAVDMVESHAQKTLEAEIKRLVERPAPFLDESVKNPEISLIEAIQLQIKGKKQMDKLLEVASESEQYSSTFINLRNENGDNNVHHLLNNLPKYANSKVWQDLIKRKARVVENTVGGAPSKVDQYPGTFSPRVPGFSHRTPMNATNLTGKKRQGVQSLTARDQQAST